MLIINVGSGPKPMLQLGGVLAMAHKLISDKASKAVIFIMIRTFLSSAVH